jgi:hypothetical protein
VSVYKFTSSLDPHTSTVWTVGGNGFFTDDQFPQFDARPLPAPGEFPPTGNSPALLCTDLSCEIEAVSPYNATYHVTVTNNSDRAMSYELRVWMP